MDAVENRAKDERVAVLGTGIMGSAMARNLLAAGPVATAIESLGSFAGIGLGQLPGKRHRRRILSCG